MPYLSPAEPLTLATLAALLRSQEPVRLGPDAEQRVASGHHYLHQRLQPPADQPLGNDYQHLTGRLPDVGLPPDEQANL